MQRSVCHNHPPHIPQIPLSQAHSLTLAPNHWDTCICNWSLKFQISQHGGGGVGNQPSTPPPEGWSDNSNTAGVSLNSAASGSFLLHSLAAASTRKLLGSEFRPPSLALPPEHCHCPLCSQDPDLDEWELPGSLYPRHFTETCRLTLNWTPRGNMKRASR